MDANVGFVRPKPWEAVVYTATAVVVFVSVVAIMVALTAATGRSIGAALGGAGATPDVLALVYAPWCTHCKLLVPVFEQLQQRGYQTVLVDGAAKGIEWLVANKITAYPTVCVMNKDTVVKLYPISGERSERAVLAFYEEAGLPLPRKP